ncbi:DUF397 domain-containing protein [Streptomyces sp. NPDC021080]|uniref:DUF397 domain-containing protein n=1 Tax=Streptomyces sp. NPDC021080 TaxID=3365110 RepID=UPI00379A1342
METNTTDREPSSRTWRKSTYSAGDGGDCLEVALGEGREGHLVPVRDSKNPGPVIGFGAAAWGAFVGHLGTTG